MPGVIHPTGLTAVYGCTSDRLWISPNLALSVLALTEPWEAPGWQVIAVDADVKQVIASWPQTLNNSVFTLEYKPWYHCGPNAEMVVVMTFRSDVYHLLHMCHVLIKVTTFWHESVCYLIFWKFFVYTLQSEQVSSQILDVLNGGVSVSFVDNLYSELFVLVVTYTLLCPHNLVTCLTQALYIESYICLVWKHFPIFCRYLCAMLGVVLLVNFIIKSKVNPCAGTEALYRPYSP